MKKIFYITAIYSFFLLFLSPSFAKYKLTISNTVGSDFDELGDYDLFSYTKETDIKDNVLSETIFSFGNQFQLDWENELIDSRFRLDMLYTTAEDSDAAFLLVPTGYVQFKLFPQLSILAGNDFFKKFAIFLMIISAVIRRRPVFRPHREDHTIPRSRPLQL